MSCVLLATAAGRDPLRKLLEEAKAAGVDDRVHLPGRQPKEQMPAVLAASDACLIHLRGCELFGTVIPSRIFETMAMSRPILMGVDGEAREIVLEAGAGLEMEPDSPESLVQCLEKRTDHPTLADAMSRAGRAYVARHYNRDDLAARYLRLLERVAGVGKPAAEAVEGRGPKSEVGRRYPHLTPDT